ncbi:MAG: translation initiation factor IF-2 [Kiritimatiellia bacterium]|jgi:translation initiation factor IF-2|nr:translation initiation factor IF-2 [Kiritimatiellia bacterium]
MRVCELAKSVRTSSVEVLKQADALGIEVYSPLSALEDQEASRLQAYFTGLGAEVMERAGAERAERAHAKQERARSRRAAQNQADRAVLEANRARALEMDVLVRGGVLPEPAVPVSAAEPVMAAAAAEAGTIPPSDAAAAPVPPQGKDLSAAATAAKPAAQKAKPARYAATEEELEPEEKLAAPFMQRIGKEPAREIPKAPRMTPGAKTRDKEVGRTPQRPVSGTPAAARPDSRPSRFAPVSQRAEPATPPDRIILLRGAVVVKELAEKLGIRANRLIADLMQLNILASINQRVEIDVAQKIAEKYGFKIEIEKAKRSTERRPVLRSEDADDIIPDDKPEELLPRPPVVTFLGHVDHGKTSLMDRIRNTRVASGEAGGITQHIGAYTVEINGRKITFLDTPGHAAFSAMRARGASLTDIAVIIIAADDGIMPQTREAIKHAQQAGVQIMIAINKCDLPSAKPDRVRQMLQGEGLTPEEWGGDVISAEVSAVTGKGVDHLLEMILLQADMLELSANPARRADGFVVEAQLEQGLGPTATLLVAGGTLNVGDTILCGEHFGKIRGLIDDRGRRVKSAGPATAVKCMGLSGVPEAGAAFRVMLNEKRARELAEKFAQERKEIELASAKATSLDALMSQMRENQRRELALIVKADTQGSSEAVCEALREIKSEKVTLNIIHEAIGNVSATDVNKAAAGQALIVGFSVGCDAGVQQLARHDGVRINTFRIIYELLDFVKQRMLDLLSPEFKEVVRGHAEIRAIFDIGKTGRVAGCQMLDGMLRADARCRIFRKKEQVWDGRFAAIKHFQNEVSEVTGSQECGIFFNGFEAFQEGDTVECYVLEELPRSL